MTAPPIWTPYCGAAPVPAELWARWNLDPLVIGALALALFAYARTRHAPVERGWFASAVAALVVLYLSPFCALGSALFSARAAHHVALAVVVAPMLAASMPRLRPPSSLALWTAAQALVFWLWHAPPVYAWALASDAGYWTMQATLLASAFGFWAAALRAPPLAAAAALLATTVQMGLLGALLTFVPEALYEPHLLATIAWGLSPLEDQQLAGLIMWVPGAGLTLGAAMIVLGRWLARETGVAKAA